MAAFDFSSSFSGIHRAFDNISKQNERAFQTQALAKLGEFIKTGDYAGAAQAAFGVGDVSTGIGLIGLGQKAKEQQREADWYKSNAGVLGGTEGSAAPMTPLGSSNVPASPRGVVVAERPEDVERLEAQSSGQTQFGNRNEPRGIRNNNPGNIEAGKFAATVQGFQGSDGRFAQYATPEDGIKAADKLLQSYAGRGLNTVAGIVNRWAPPTENNTGAYAASVARELGVAPDQPLDMSNWQTRQRLIAAKIRVENGKQPYAEDVFQRALNPNWGSQVAQYSGPAQQPTQTAQAPAFLGNEPPPASGFTPQGQPAPQPSPSQVAEIPVGAGGVYAGVDAATLNGYLNNPNVPPNLKALVKQELASRQGGGAPVQVAQAPAQPGAPTSDAPNQPAPGAAEAQFTIPGTTPQQTQGIMQDRQVQNLLRALDGAPERAKASVQKRLELRIEELKNARGEEGRAVDIELKREQLAKAKREAAGEVPPPPGYRYKANSRDLEPISGGPADNKAGREIAERTAIANERGLQGEARDAYVFNGRLPVGSEKAATEGQANAALYADRMKEADLILRDPKIAAASIAPDQRILSNVPLASNFLVSSEYQQAEQAQRNFINATLRRESGAAISPTEFENARKQYFPQPGDKPEVLSQKAKNRQTAIQGIGNAAGPGYAKRQTQPSEQPAAAPERPAPPSIREGARAQGPNGQIVILRNGQWVSE